MELFADTETKNVKPLKVLESYWRTCGVQLFVRFYHGSTHLEDFQYVKSGTILGLLVLVFKIKYHLFAMGLKASGSVWSFVTAHTFKDRVASQRD
ncbi:hypothetical protein [Aeromonas molluscorum]|uniref:hypothetical protein n=1 Tax=Aeromonas molluscorum TaxID=271417 RepID=UPI003F1B7DDE